ncbi:MAG: hexose kinase [Spirochaetaceae bacterium]|nr:MAG: hexose kinase [Spirochaetaceae bacterium]
MILVVGHNPDWKKIYRISKMEVGRVNRLEASEFFPAGKGANTARVLMGLGEKVLLLSYFGGNNGHRFREAIRAEGIPHRYVRTSGETRTCLTILESGGLTTELIEPAAPLKPAEVQRFETLFRRSLSKAKLLVVAGTSLPGTPEDCYRGYIQKAKKRTIPTILDSYRAHGKLALDASPEVLKINLFELESLTGMSLANVERRKAAFRQVRDSYGLQWIVITRGAEGVEGFDGQRHFRALAPRIKVQNPIGSGDAVTAGIAHTLLRGESLELALHRGAALGTANCLNLHPGRIEPSEYEDILSRIEIRTF